MTVVGRFLRSLSPRAILVIGLALPIIYAFPGMMSQDSFDILLEARSGVFTDPHPPMVAMIWRVCDAIVPGAFLMLLIQLVAFELGVFLLLRRVVSPRAAAWLAVAVLAFPPILAPMGMIWKDCLMAAMLVLGAGLLASSERRAAQLGGLVALFVATGVRYNAFPAVFPIMLLLFRAPPTLTGWRRYLTSFIAWLGITTAAFATNDVLTDRPMYMWSSTLAIHDIAGTLSNLDGELSDAEMETLLAGTEPLVHQHIHATIRATYNPAEFMYLVSLERAPIWNMPLYGEVPAPKARRDAVAALWKKLVTEHPRAYAAHRLAVTREVLGLHTAPPSGAIPRRIPYYPGIARNLGLNSGWSRAQVYLSHALIDLWRTVPIFAPWIYALLTLVLLPFARRDALAGAILLSGLFLEGTLLVLAHSADFRYSHWLIITTTLGTLLVGSRRFRKSERLTDDE